MNLLKLILASFSLIGTMGLWAQTLQFGSDRKFKIVQFTDIHWKTGVAESEVSEKCMIRVLEEEQPDLVVFTGDFVTGKPAAKGIDELLQPTLSRKIPFAMTFGNHDDEQDMTRRELFDFIRKYSGSLIGTTEGISGVFNYILTVKSSSGLEDAAVLYLFDSNSYAEHELVKGYDWIKSDQIEWYVGESRRLTTANQGKTLPALAFFHIPLPEYNEAARDENAPLVGTRREKACSPQLNTGLFSAMFHCGDVMGVFVGHDHVNDYVVDWKGILLCYGRFTGSKNTYGDIPGGNGARVIELTEGEHGFKSWIRLHDGRVINEVAYPADFRK